MTYLAINLKEVDYFISLIERIEKNFPNISDEENEKIINFIKFLNYPREYPSEEVTLYRVRKSKDTYPFSKKQDLLYPPKNMTNQGRMNDKNTIMLYTSTHEFTAISESRLKENDLFQLTSFKINKEIKVFYLGYFTHILFNYWRNGKQQEEIFKKFRNDDITAFSALEIAIINKLYQKTEDYNLSSYISNQIFSTFPDIDAIQYPSIQHNFGFNFAIKKDFVDNHIEIDYSCFNQLTTIYKNGFFKYKTTYELIDFDDSILKYRSTYKDTDNILPILDQFR